MRKFFLLPLLAFAAVAVNAATADAQFLVDREAAKRFATMTEDANFPEGITVNPANGDIYVSTFHFGGDNFLVRFDKSGRFISQTADLFAPILGLAFNTVDDMVYFCFVDDFTGGANGGSQIKRISTDLSTIQVVADIPGIGPPPNREVLNPDTSIDTIEFGQAARVPNALAFNASGDKLFFSDSFQGAVFRIDDPDACGPACTVDTVVHDGLLATAGSPAFGANGLALSDDEMTLFVANTGDDRVLKLPIDEDGDADGDLAVFAESINGADGLAFDDEGRLWVAANQADEMVALDGDGKVIAKLGDFLGIRKDGAVKGLIFPASVVIHDRQMFVTNAALTGNDIPDDEVEEGVTTYTVARIKIPNFTGANSRTR